MELPLKVLVIGDFTLRKDDTPLDERKPISVDKDNFEDVLRAQNIKLTMSVENELSTEGGEMAVNLDIQSIKDFTPDEIVHKVPELKKLIDLRDALKALKGPIQNKQFKKRIQELVHDEETKARLLKELGIEK